MFVNRVGDSLFLISIGRLLYIVNLNYFLLTLNFNNQILLILLLIIIASRTKRAQLPFSRWLPAAIAAPTPVSSLVHSSTLVTAGLYILIRISISLNSQLLLLIMIFGISTFYLAGLSATCEIDIKKIVALSTLSQLGFIIFSIGLNFLNLAFFHLITHAFSKAFFFIITGYLIHSGQDFQDLRKGSKKNINTSYILYNLHLFVAVVLCGLPNFIIFFSKDYILEYIIENWSYYFRVIFIYSSFIITSMYTTRLFIIILSNNYRSRLYMYMENNFINYSILKNSIMFLLLIIPLSKILLYLLIFEECFVIEMSTNEKNLTFLFLLVGLLLGLYINYIINSSYLVWFFWSFRSMWFLSFRLTNYYLITTKSQIKSSIFNIDRFFLPNIMYEMNLNSVVDKFRISVSSYNTSSLKLVFLIIIWIIIFI